MKFLDNFNWLAILCILFLLSISFLVIFSSARELAYQQGIFAILGFLVFLVIARFDYRGIVGFIKPAFLVILVMLVVVIILGIETRGSTRWIPLGPVNIQPSEFAKPVLILFLAYFWSETVANWKSILKSLLWVAPLAILIFEQPDLGTMLTILSIYFGMLFVTKISKKIIATIIAIVLIMIPITWLRLHDYQKQRIWSFLSPTSDPLGEGYNIIQSTIAVGSGGFLGRGLGHGTQSRLQFLPEYRTDFIFAAISEELGFLGALLILVIYAGLIFYCLRTASRASDQFGFLIAAGVAVMLTFQAFVNIGMNIGILPITGITLPLMSYGGSSLIATMISLGFVASVAKNAQKS